MLILLILLNKELMKDDVFYCVGMTQQVFGEFEILYSEYYGKTEPQFSHFKLEKHSIGDVLLGCKNTNTAHRDASKHLRVYYPEKEENTESITLFSGSYHNVKQTFQKHFSL